MSPSHRHVLIGSYLILNITSGTTAGAMQVAVPLYALSLHAALGDVGFIRGVSGLGMLLLVIPAGFLVDHYGAKRLFLVGGLCGTLATCGLVFAASPGAIALLMGVAGLFAALKMTALNSSFFTNLQAMGIEKAGWFKGSMSIGLAFLGPLLGGCLVEMMDFGALFQLFAALTLVPIALVFFFHDDPPVRSLDDGGQSGLIRQLTEFRALLRQRSLYLPLLTECLSTALFATFSAFIVVIAVQSLHLQTTVASVLMSIEGGVFIVTVFAAGRLIRTLSQLQLYVLSVSVVVGGLFALAFAESFLALAGSTAILGLGLGLINLVVSSRIARIEGEKGKIVGLFSAAIGVGISLGPMSGGVIGSWLGTSAIFLAFVPLFLVLMAAAVRLDLRRRRPSAAGGAAKDAVARPNDSIGEFHEFAESKAVH